MPYLTYLNLYPTPSDKVTKQFQATCSLWTAWLADANAFTNTNTDRSYVECG